MMPFEVPCGNFKCCNKFLFLQYISCFHFFYPKDIPVPVFASSFFFMHITFCTDMLKKKKKERKRETQEI